MKKKWWTYQELVDNNLLHNLFYSKNYYLYEAGNIIEGRGTTHLGYAQMAQTLPVTPNIAGISSLFYGPYKADVIPNVPKKLDKRIKDQMIIENIIK